MSNDFAGAPREVGPNVTTRILGEAEAKPEPSRSQPRAKRGAARSSRDKIMLLQRRKNYKVDLT